MKTNALFSAKILCASLLVLPAFQSAIFATDKESVKEPTAQQVPLESDAAFWSKSAKLISYRCKDLKLEARSRINPSVTFNLSQGLFNEKDCKLTVKQVETKGCFCDDAILKCLESEKIEPIGIVCPMGFFCFEFRGKKTGVIRVKELGNHYTRSACEKEFAALERD